MPVTKTMSRNGMTDCPIEDAHRLYDNVGCELLHINGWDADSGDVSVTTPDGESILVEGALQSDRYVPVQLSGFGV